MPSRLLLLILLLPFPLYPAEAPAAATPGARPTATAPAVTTAPATAAPLFTDAEWQHGQGSGNPAQEGSGVVGKAAVGLLVSLVVIAVIAGGLAFAVRKLGMRRVLPGRGQYLKVIETVPLGFKRSVSLVRIGDQVLVVGLGEHDLSHLATLPASVLDELPARTGGAVLSGVPDPAPAVPPPASAFRAVLDSIVGRRA